MKQNSFFKHYTWTLPALIGTALFVILCSFFLDFIVDDAFITFRYAQHLVEGNGIVWNVGEDPVEGYTSTLWMLLNAAGIWFGGNPVIVSKVLLFLFGVMSIWLLAWEGRRLSRPAALFFVLVLAAQPAYALLTMQAMETTLTALLLLGASLCAMRFIRTPSWAHGVCWYGLSFLSLLARPDALFFVLPLFIGIVWIFVQKKDWASIRLLGLLGIPTILLGIAYLFWRVQYFGYLFPNPFYIKFDVVGTFLSAAGFDYFHSFFWWCILPSVLFTVAYSIRKRTALASPAFGASTALPIFVASGIFFLYTLTVTPIQAYAWRYIFPAFPAFLFACIHLCVSADRRPAKFFFVTTRWFSALACVAIVGWNFLLLPRMFYEEQFRTPNDRVRVGKQLAGIDGVLLISESGAIPFYSGWKAVDVLGLNSERITHEGFSAALLEELHPDLIMLLRDGGPPMTQSDVTIDTYIREQQFVPVAVIYKSFDNYHIYFARQDSPLFGEIRRRLQTVEGVTYLDLEDIPGGKNN